MEGISKFAVGAHGYDACNSCAEEGALKEVMAKVGTVMLLNSGDNDGRAEAIHSAEDALVTVEGDLVGVAWGPNAEMRTRPGPILG